MHGGSSPWCQLSPGWRPAVFSPEHVQDPSSCLLAAQAALPKPLCGPRARLLTKSIEAPSLPESRLSEEEPQAVLKPFTESGSLEGVPGSMCRLRNLGVAGGSGRSPGQAPGRTGGRACRARGASQCPHRHAPGTAEPLASLCWPFPGGPCVTPSWVSALSPGPRPPAQAPAPGRAGREQASALQSPVWPCEQSAHFVKQISEFLT